MQRRFMYRFNPPPRRAVQPADDSGPSSSTFQSSPAPEGECNQCPSTHTAGAATFQSSPAPEGECNRWAGWLRVRPVVRFQSSPAPEGECNRRYHLMGNRVLAYLGFNPHPPRRASATVGFGVLKHQVSTVSILTRPGGRVQLVAWNGREAALTGFNPHPPRRASAIQSASLSARCEFQSSPAPEGSATHVEAIQELRDGIVSILTRPGGRVQRGLPAGALPGFQSSPAPEGECNRDAAV